MRFLDGYRVGDEEVSCGEEGSDDELGDLHGGERAFDPGGHLDPQRGQRIVRILEKLAYTHI